MLTKIIPMMPAVNTLEKKYKTNKYGNGKKKLERKIVDKKMILDTIESKVKPQCILQFYYFASGCYHY